MVVTAEEIEIVLRARDNASGVINQVENSISSLGRSGGLLSGLMGMLAQIGLAANGVQALGQAAQAAGNALGIQFNASLETSEIAFTALMKSADGAKQHLQDLMMFARDTPFEQAGLISASRQLQGVGINSSAIIPLLTAVGDAVGGVGGSSVSIQRVTLALSQMVAKGKLSGEEFRQMAETGVPAFDLLAKGLGISVPEAMDKVSKGVIPLKEGLIALTKEMEDRYGGLMVKLSTTFTGSVSTIKDAISITIGTAFQPLFDIVTKTFVVIGSFMTSKVVESWALGFKASLKVVEDEILTFVTTVQNIAGAHGVGYLTASIIALENRLKEVFGAEVAGYFHRGIELVLQVIGVVGALYTILSATAEKIIVAWGPVLQEAFIVAKMLALQLYEAVLLGTRFIFDHLEVLLTLAMVIGAALIPNLIRSTALWVANSVTGVLGNIVAMTMSIASMFSVTASLIIMAGQLVFSAGMWAVLTVAEALNAIAVLGVFGALQYLTLGFTTSFVAMGRFLISMGMTTIAYGIQAAAAIALAFTTGGLTGVLALVATSFYSLAVTAITAAGAMVAPFLPVILVIGAVAAAAFLLYKAWSSNFAGIRDVVSSVFNWVVSKLEQVAGAIADWGRSMGLPVDSWIAGAKGLASKTSDAWDSTVKSTEDMSGQITKLLGDITSGAAPSAADGIDEMTKKMKEALAGQGTEVGSEAKKTSQQIVDEIKKGLDASSMGVDPRAKGPGGAAGAKKGSELQKLGAEMASEMMRGVDSFSEAGKAQALKIENAFTMGVTQGIGELQGKVTEVSSVTAAYIAKLGDAGVSKFTSVLATLRDVRDMVTSVGASQQAVREQTTRVHLASEAVKATEAVIQSNQDNHKRAMVPLQNQLTDLERQSRDVSEEMVPIHEQIQEVDRRIADLRKEDVGRAREMLTINTELLPLKNQVAEIDARISQATAQNYDRTIELARLNNDLISPKRALEDIDRRISLLKKNDLDVDEKILRAQMALIPSKTKLADLQDRISGVRNQGLSLEQEAKILEIKKAQFPIERALQEVQAKMAEARLREKTTQKGSSDNQNAIDAQKSLELEEARLQLSLTPFENRIKLVESQKDWTKILDDIQTNALEKEKLGLEATINAAQKKIDKIQDEESLKDQTNKLAIIGLERERVKQSAVVQVIQDKIDALNSLSQIEEANQRITVAGLNKEKSLILAQMAPLEDRLKVIGRTREDEALRNQLTIMGLEAEKLQIADQLVPLKAKKLAIDTETAAVKKQIQTLEERFETGQRDLILKLISEKMVQKEQEKTLEGLKKKYAAEAQALVDALEASGNFTKDEALEVVKRLGYWDSEIAKVNELAAAIRAIPGPQAQRSSENQSPSGTQAGSDFAWGDFNALVNNGMDREEASRLVRGVVSEAGTTISAALSTVGTGLNGSAGGFSAGNSGFTAMASGGRGISGGLTLVGEAGPELVRLPLGSDVIPANPTSSMLSGGSKGSGEDNRPIVIQLDGNVIARTTWKVLKKQNLIGTSLGLQ